ncbi:hypothetical protein J437_LFUL005605 [Ladona fulva]|uniref:Uncharacterized protein n=1 Tax=Ladona fulva TaxID=123851 RepID=A0A8K0NY32_LADFU|nr:hypothetical protein J437_LFUL005605 [Ladona fulva]
MIQGYLWEKNEAVVEWLSRQLDKNSQHSVVYSNIKCVKKDAIIQSIRNSLEDCPEAALDAVIEMVQHLSPLQRSDALRHLSHLEEEGSGGSVSSHSTASSASATNSTVHTSERIGE